MEDFEQLYHLYSKMLYKYLFYLSGDKQLADDLLQETFYQAIKSIFRFNGNSKVSTWLYKIARNVYLKHLYKVRKEKLTSLSESEAMICLDTPDVIVAEKEENESIFKAISELEEPYREIIFLRAYNDLSFREIGNIFQRSEGWARTNFYRGKLQLKNLLSDYSEEV